MIRKTAPKYGATPRKQPKKLNFPAVSIRTLPKPARWFFGGLLLLVSVGMLLSFGFGNLSWQIRAIEFDQVLYYQDASELNQLMQSQIGKNLIETQVAEIKKELDALPWIESSEIKVQWPGILNIEVVEERPIAIWNDQQLVSQTGKLFQADRSRFELPVLYADEAALEQVLSHYMTFNKALMPYGQIIKSLQLSKGGSWTLETESGLSIRLGADQVRNRFRRALRFVGNLGEQTEQIDYIDARYNNGVAYRLKVTNGENAA